MIERIVEQRIRIDFKKILRDIVDLFRYDIPAFFKNLWNFKEALWSFRDYDSMHSLNMLKFALIRNAIAIQNGYEEEESKNRKVLAIYRAVTLIEHSVKDDYLELAEKELGELIRFDIYFKKIDKKDEDGQDLYEKVNNLSDEESAFNSKLYKRSREIEDEQWIELINILKGQKDVENFDGNGMKTWWE